MVRNVIWLLLLCTLSLGTLANEPLTVKFASQAQAEQYERITVRLRCLVCQNQTIADSSSELADDLRKKVRDLVVSGKTDKQIYEYFTERYGDFVLYEPVLDERTWLLWFGPLLFLFLGGVFVFCTYSRRPAA